MTLPRSWRHRLAESRYRVNELFGRFAFQGALGPDLVVVMTVSWIMTIQNETLLSIPLPIPRLFGEADGSY